MATKPDIIDELAHEVVHDLARIDRALHNFMKLARRCPYAGKPGCMCNVIDRAIARENTRNNKA